MAEEEWSLIEPALVSGAEALRRFLVTTGFLKCNLRKAHREWKWDMKYEI